MGRRLVSVIGRVKGGPARGGSTREIRVYDDEALTTLSTLYARSSGGTTQPNGAGLGACMVPNAGKQVFLTADRAAGDAFVIVTDVSPFHVGDLIPIYDVTNTVYKVVTVITPATKRLDLDQTLGFAFTAAAAKVNNADMEGHLWFWVDDAVDKFAQVKELATGRLLPPLNFPVRTPLAATAYQEEGVSTGASRTILNFIGRDVTAVDNAGAGRVDVTIPAASVTSNGTILSDDQKRLTTQDLGNVTGAITIDLSLGDNIRATLTGSISITLTNPVANHDYKFVFTSGGAFTITWTTTVKWAGGSAPVHTVTSGKKDIYLLGRDGSDYLGTATLNC